MMRTMKQINFARKVNELEGKITSSIDSKSGYTYEEIETALINVLSSMHKRITDVMNK